MKLHISFSVALILMACSYQGALAHQNPKGNCPVISVSQLDGARSGPTQVFKVYVQGGDRSVIPKYNWTISRGKILSGQGTAEVSVDFGAIDSFAVTAEVLGYAAGCRNTASYALIIERPVPARKFDDYRDLKFSEERLRLDQFALALHNEPGAYGYIIVYDARDTRKPAARQRGERAKNYLVKERGLQEGRIVVVNGGHRDQRSVELFIVPAGASPPTVTPKR